MTRPLRILVLADTQRSHAGTMREHIASFRRYSAHRVDYFNPRDVASSRHLDLSAYDVVVVHYSLVLIADSYVAPWLRERLAAYSGLKVQFLQDEYRWVDQVTAAMREVGIDVLFSIVTPREIEKVYGGRLDGVQIVPTLAGYVPEDLVARRSPPIAGRPIDVGYRGRVLPPWIGALGQEKVAVGQGFFEHAAHFDLKLDIAWSEDDRLYGVRWNRFLESCRTVLGSESGASITDFDGTLERRSLEYLDEQPGATFEAVHAAVLAPYEGNVMMNVISPRSFEAAALGTAMVNFPGEYGGILEPYEHYVPLEKDFSNIGEVVDAIRDTDRLQAQVERTHADLIASGRYSLRTFVKQFDEIVAERALPFARPRPSLNRAQVERALQTKEVLGYDLAAAANTAGRIVALALMTAADPALRRTLAAYATSPAVRREVRLRRLWKDLLRAGVLRRAQCGLPVTTTSFVTATDFDDETGRLSIVGLPEEEREVSPPASAPSVRAAIQGGRVREIVWNHTRVGGFFLYMLTGRHLLGVEVGYYGQPGIYEFGALRAVAGRLPGVVSDLLEPLGEAPRPRQPLGPLAAAALRALPGATGRRILDSPRAVALLASPRTASVLALLTAGALAKPQSAPLLRAWIKARDGARPSIWDVLTDAFRLDIVKRAHRARIGSVGRADVRVDGDEVRLVTALVPIEYGNPWVIEFPTAPRRVFWDNSAIGPTLSIPFVLNRVVEVDVGPAGVVECEALGWLARVDADGLRHAILHEPANVRLRRRLGAYGALGVARALASRGPRATAAAGALLARSLATPAERGLILAALRNHRSVTPLLAELVRLRSLREHAAGRAGGPVVAVESDDDRLTYVTRTEPDGRLPERRDPPASIVWDNRAFGRMVTLQTRVGALTIGLGEDGVYEFRVLASLLPHIPSSNWQALLPAPQAGHAPE